MCGTDNVKRSASSSAIASDAVINLDHGDPMIFESYWRKMGDKCRVVMEGHESLSYFADVKNLCWYMEPKLEKEIRRLHHTVGNAVVEDHYVVVGTGSSQLIQAALYALSSPDQPHPNSIVSAVPYYSSYVEIVEILRSGLYKWGGDARTFDKEGPYIELITSPNNPDGIIREATVNRGDQGKLVHDLAYYWPQYTPITSPANFDIMLFTASKCTGHAGSRIGWALVKDKEVAKRMIKFVEVNTIGVSKESQRRTAKILGVVSDSCLCVDSPEIENFFEYGQRIMAERWKRLRDVVKRNEVFSLPKYPIVYCHFTREYTETHPAFAWMKCKEKIEDCEKFLREKKIATRSGRRFGTDPHHVRVSMLNKDEEFELFLERLKDIQVDESQ